MLSKNFNDKKFASKLVFFNEKKKKKIKGFLTLKIEFDSQILALLDTSLLHQFSKFNNFLWVCWFLDKNLSNFVTPNWKLDNLYYHTQGGLNFQNTSNKLHTKSFERKKFLNNKDFHPCFYILVS